MNIHEYQAKQLLAKYGVPVPKGGVAFTPDEAVKAAEALGGPVWVVKSQIHAGGRGKGGGVKLVKSIDAVRAEATRMLGMTLVTHQTGPEGKEVGRVYVEDGCDIARELYLSLLVDRDSKRINIIASTEGGMDIEEVAEHSPEKILSLAIDPVTGLQAFHSTRIAYALGLEGAQVKSVAKFLKSMYQAFVELDASMVEINPMVVTGAGAIMALDAKMNFDDNALYRHADIAAMRDDTEENALELEAQKYALNYVALDGTIGCMVNGAGLAMATMDIIKLYGEEPANFLDVGGNANKETVEAAFKIIMSAPKVEAILINIFGGIARCDVIADGVVAAAKGMNLQIPLVVRLEGTNVEKGKEILKNSGLAIIPADNLADAAAKVVAAAKEAR
jgi:succinyl-CoA synthetase beta subunit